MGKREYVYNQTTPCMDSQFFICDFPILNSTLANTSIMYHMVVECTVLELFNSLIK